MSRVETIERHTRQHEQIPLQPAAVSSHEETCPDPVGNRTLYVLAFGVLGAISTNTFVFIYFASFYAFG
jgi:hypothetical protein